MMPSTQKTVELMLLLVLLAAGGAMAGERFVDNGDGTITDRQLNLMWARHDNQGDVSWIQARRWITLTLPYTLPARYDNWRMPTLTELKSLVTKGKNGGYETDCGQWVHIIPQIRLSCGWVWTSETDTIAPVARVFNFANVYHYTVRKVHKRAYRALAVRDIR